jgi:hypothetical protein
MAWSAALETDMKNIKKFGGVLLFALGAATAWPVPAAPTDKPAPAPAPPPTASVPVIPHTDTLAGMFRDGKLLLHLRMRYENADDDARQEAVDVGSLRTALGFRTASFHGLFGLAEVEDVLAVGTYDDGGTNRRMAPRYSAVVDPEGVELNQAYVGIDAIPHTVIQAGRQLILDRDAPFHRYLGNVLWRQNWQTFDAVSVANNSLPDTVVRFWYTWNVNRIFGEGHPTRGFDDEGLNGYLGNVVYTGLPFGRLEFYAYLLDFERSVVPAIRSFYPSTQTYGARFDGKYALNPKFDVLYIAEGAWQGDFSHNPTGNIDQPFLWGMLGGSYKLGGVVQSVTMKASVEFLGGDGGANRFTTPLATGHAFQGWADRFLNTPGDGIQDVYLTFQAVVLGANFMIEHHWFDSDNGSYSYGHELDVQLTKTFLTKYTAGIKYADYDADQNAHNIARNSGSGQAFDLRKVWVWLEYRY